MTVTVVPIRLRLSNAYLVRGERPILVDTGGPQEAEMIVKAMAKEGLAVSDLALILQTHGHSDHCGNTWELRQRSGAPVAIHEADAEMLSKGRNRPLKVTRWQARLIRPFANQPFPGVKADLLISDEMSLTSYGIEGRVITTPGHTWGSISLLLNNNEAIVGDLLMGGALGGVLFPTRPAYHYFVEDMEMLRASIQKMIGLSPSLLHVGHGGPLSPASVVRRFANHIPF